jgi:hypothetical protein
MPRSIVLLVAVPALALAGIWPDNLGEFRRVSAAPVIASDARLWDEYGLQEAEEAHYESAGRLFTALAYRFQDSTGAMAAFQWQRPAEAKTSQLGKLAVETPKLTMLAHGNYLLQFEDHRPPVSEIETLLQTVPKLDQSPVPVLSSYLPSENLVANSERYVSGPSALEKFEPRIPAATAAFHLGSEAQIGTFRSANGDMKLAIFSYPTPQIAMLRLEEFQKIPGIMAKRSGLLIAAIVAPPSAEEAEKLLSQVRYQATITLSERVPTRRDNIGDLILNVFALIGILLAFCAVAGIAVGGLRGIIRPDGEPITVLHLGDRG